MIGRGRRRIITIGTLTEGGLPQPGGSYTPFDASGLVNSEFSLGQPNLNSLGSTDSLRGKPTSIDSRSA